MTIIPLLELITVETYLKVASGKLTESTSDIPSEK